MFKILSRLGLLSLFIISCFSTAQPPQKTISHQLSFSEFIADEYPTYGVANMSVLQLNDVSGPFQANQCLKRNAANSGWVGGQCGTGGGGGRNWPARSSWASGSSRACGEGVPSGGTSGQVLAKTSNANYATAWVDNPHAGVSASDLALVKTTADGASQVSAISLSGSDLSFASSGGQTASVDLSGVASSFEIKSKLESLSGNQRLSAVAIKDLAAGLPTGGTAGQVLAKRTSQDYVVGWVNQTGGGGGSANSIIALDAVPGNLEPYADNTVLRINNPSPGQWLEVEEQTKFGHGVKITSATSGVNQGGLTGWIKHLWGYRERRRDAYFHSCQLWNLPY